MSKIDDGGPAFPVVGDYLEIDPEDMKEKFSGVHFQAPGMSLRDAMAIAAMNGELSAGVLPTTKAEAEAHAVMYYNIADAMIAERKKARE